MAAQFVLYHNPMSRGRIAHWMLEETGAEYEVRLLSLEKGENRQPGFLSVNPMGKLPALAHGDVVITESAAICTYLADLFPQANLAPPIGNPARGTYLRWMFFGAGCMEPAITDRMLARPQPERRGAVGYGSYDDTINTLERALAPGPYLTGDQFTAADLYVSSALSWAMRVKAVDPRPAFLAYVERCSARPAAKRMNEQNEKYLAQMKAQS